jgi:hypothetical protein
MSEHEEESWQDLGRYAGLDGDEDDEGEHDEQD